MKRVMVMLVTVILCSLSAWCEPQLIGVALEILNNNQSISEIEKILDENGFSVSEKVFDENVNCTFSISANNKEFALSTSTEVPQVTVVS